MGLIIFLMINQTFGTDFKEIDHHALNTPKWAERSPEQLVLYLIQPAKNDVEKIRSIFRWVTENIAYNVESIHNGYQTDLTSEMVLQKRSGICEGFTNLVEDLALRAGLEIVTISGYAKGLHYHMGDSFKGPPNHAWNGIKINGKWYLLDATWGAGHINEKGIYVQQFDDHFFFTPPEEMIYTHFPIDSKWQLLHDPITLNTFEELVHLKSMFFHYNIRLLSHRKGIIKTDGEVSIALYMPDYLTMHADLYHRGRLFDQNLVFIQCIDTVTTVRVRISERGDYLLKIFAKEKNDSQSHLYQSVCEYQIKAQKGLKESGGFPEIFQGYYDNQVYLFSPMNGYLKTGKAHHFELKIPNSIKAGVMIGEKFIPLDQYQSLFFGDITISQRDMEVTVYAEFSGQNSYRGLLRYRSY